MTAIETVGPSPGKRNCASGPRQRDDGVAVERLAVEQREVAQIDAALLVDAADLVDRRDAAARARRCAVSSLVTSCDLPSG